MVFTARKKQLFVFKKNSDQKKIKKIKLLSTLTKNLSKIDVKQMRHKFDLKSYWTEIIQIIRTKSEEKSVDQYYKKRFVILFLDL